MTARTENPDSELLDSLTSDNGVLAAGMVPALNLGTDEGMKSLAASLGGDVKKVKPIKRPKGEEQKEVHPTTAKETRPQYFSGTLMKVYWFQTSLNDDDLNPSVLGCFLSQVCLRKAQDLMEEVLKEGGEARKLAISLKFVEYGDTLMGELMEHSKTMEKLYGGLRSLVASDAKDSHYEKLTDHIKEKMAWFEKAKVGLLSQDVASTYFKTVHLK